MALDAKWKATVDDGKTNAAWGDHDATIKAEIDDYNVRLATTKGFTKLDWKLFKAVLWVESGGPKNAAWKGRAMQIGNPGDKGLDVVKNGKEAAPLIMSDKLKTDIKGNIEDPKLNIRAGIAYALTRLAQSDEQSVDDAKDPKVYEHTIASGENFDVVAKKVGSTVESIKKQNPGVVPTALKVGQKIKYKKAKRQRVLTGWTAATTASLASKYNGNGDPDYQAKLDYVLSIMPK